MCNQSPIIGISTNIAVDERGEESFTMKKSYARAIAHAGGIPLFIPSLIENKNIFQNIASRINGLLLPGGKDIDPSEYNEKPHPALNLMKKERFESEKMLLRHAVKRNLAVLGICGGMQMINVFFEGSLYQDIPSLLPEAIKHADRASHPIIAMPSTLFSKICGKGQFSVYSYHHQAVKTLGKGLKIAAKSPDGVIEAIEKEDAPFFLGIQWHPEKENTPISTRIFNAFINSAKQGMENKGF